MSEQMGRPPKYPWKEMNVGDYFSLPYERKIAVSRVCTVNKALKPKKFRVFDSPIGIIVKRIS